MTSQRRGKRSKVSEAGANPVQSPSCDISAKPTPSYEEIRLGAYEVYLERGSIPGMGWMIDCELNANAWGTQRKQASRQI
jgi:hypothetical protein